MIILTNQTTKQQTMEMSSKVKRYLTASPYYRCAVEDTDMAFPDRGTSAENCCFNKTFLDIRDLPVLKIPSHGSGITVFCKLGDMIFGNTPDHQVEVEQKEYSLDYGAHLELKKYDLTKKFMLHSVDADQVSTFIRVHFEFISKPRTLDKCAFVVQTSALRVEGPCLVRFHNKNYTNDHRNEYTMRLYPNDSNIFIGGHFVEFKK